MSLIDEMMVDCHLIERVRNPDGEGGFITTYTKGVAFRSAIVHDTSMNTRIAEVSGFKNAYTVTTKRTVTLEYHDLFMRDSDGKVFRVTSDGSDNTSPRASSLDMRQVSAEEYIIKQE